MTLECVAEDVGDSVHHLSLRVIPIQILQNKLGDELRRHLVTKVQEKYNIRKFGTHTHYYRSDLRLVQQGLLEFVDCAGREFYTLVLQLEQQHILNIEDLDLILYPLDLFLCVLESVLRVAPLAL